MSTFHLLLPPRADNTFNGHRLALWVLGAVLTLKCAIALGSIFNGPAAATGADGIPLGTFSPAGTQAFVSLLAALGLASLTLNLVGVIVLMRYRALVPLVYLLLLGEHLGRRMVYLILPMPRTGAPPGSIINWVLVAVLGIGLTLALWRRAPTLMGRESDA